MIEKIRPEGSPQPYSAIPPQVDEKKADKTAAIGLKIVATQGSASQNLNENPLQGKSSLIKTWNQTLETVTAVFKLLFHPFLRQERIPYFKDEEWEGEGEGAIDGIQDVVEGEYTNEKARSKKASETTATAFRSGD